MTCRILFSVLLIFSAVNAEDTTQSPGEEMVDRLAVNLAGAFVKSMFPEMDRKPTSAPEASTPAPVPQQQQGFPVSQNNIRRAPINPLLMDMNNYSPQMAASEFNAIPQMGQMSDTPKNPFSYQAQQPSQYSLMPETSRTRMSQTAGMDGGALGAMAMQGITNPDIASMMGGQGGSPEAINAVRNQAYLAELSKHQSELNAYSAKQMEYLDQQRRYQQAMIDHQAGAALLMQKQQQDVIAEQMKKLKQSYGMEEANNGPAEDNSPGSFMTARARGAKTMKVPTNRKLEDDDVIANDEYLKEYFKQKYNIDIPDDVSQLTADEKATLRALKRELTRQKDKVKDTGVFKTMDGLKGKMTRERAPAKQSVAGEACDQCIPLNMKMLRGAWTQIYGNPKVVNKVFGTVMSLENLKSTEGNARMTRKKTACVGMEVGATSSSRKSTKVNLFFRDTEEGNELHEMRGTVAVRDNILNIETNLYRTQMCLVKAGPSEANRFEYIVLAETSGKNACRSYHVFARDTDEFNRRHFDHISEFMTSEIENNNVLPVGALPKSSYCQLNSP
ncbi:unnamed protein product [Caenorhabditis angaria]|uniref:Uncharacterized protein n=1 Tax=Caenorhabditis angaria TaxID=860376 RepID=A0A9P1J0L3_9PELO|nr:unnamed protein product [Caenorhabditis angaria]